VAGEGFEGEGLGDEVAEGVGTVGAGAVGFVEVGGDCAGGIGGPGDLFEVLDEFAAFGVDEEAGFAVVGVAEAAVDAVDAVADGGVRGGEAIDGPIGADPHGEELLDDGPIGGGGGGAFLVAAGIAINMDGDGALRAGNAFINGFDALEKSLAGGFGIGVGENDFVKDVDHIVDALHEEHAHGVDIEIEGPDDGIFAFEQDGDDVAGAVEGVIDAMAAGANEFGVEFLGEGVGVELAGGGVDFFRRDQAALGGGELESGPVGVVVGVFELLV